MDYTLAGLRQEVLVDKLDDDGFDASIVDRALNRAQQDVFNQFELPFQEKIFVGTIPINSKMIQMPADLASAQSYVVTSPDGKQMDIGNRYIPFREFNRIYPTPGNNTPGQIGHWTLYAGNMLTSAPTDQTYTLTVFYIKKPDLLVNNDDVPEIPEEFSELLVLGAFIRILKRNEDYDLAAQQEVEYERQLTMLVNRYGFRKSDGPIKMQNSQV